MVAFFMQTISNNVSRKWPLFEGVKQAQFGILLICFCAIIGAALVSLGFLVGMNAGKPLDGGKVLSIQSSELTESPTSTPTPTSTQIPTLPSSPKENNTASNKQKEAEIERIDNRIRQILELQKGDIELLRKAAETMKQCTSVWCAETLKNEAQYWQSEIEEKNKEIEALELQRAIITSGL